jgi:hypothetical protein
MKWTDDQYQVRRASGFAFTHAIHTIDGELDGSNRILAMLKIRPLPFPEKGETQSRVCLSLAHAMLAADADDAYQRSMVKTKK